MTFTLQEIEAMCAEATHGPWDWEDAGNGELFLSRKQDPDGGFIVLELTQSAVHPTPADSRFISAARTFVPELIARIKELDPGYNAAPSKETAERVAELEAAAAAKRAKLDKAIADAKLGDASDLEKLGLEAFIDDAGDVKIRPRHRGSHYTAAAK